MADIFTKNKRSQIMAAIKGKHTLPESNLAHILKELRLKAQFHRKDLPGCPDAVLPKKRVVIFINGCFWHGHPNCRRAALPSSNTEFWTSKISKNRIRDLRKNRMLRKSGWHVLTFWTCKKLNQERVSAKLRSYTEVLNGRQKLKART